MSRVKTYELTVLLQPQLAEDARKAVIERITNLVNNGNAESGVQVNHWGLRNLAYPINDFREAYYVYFEGPMQAQRVREIEREFNYIEDVVRYLFIRKDE